MTPVSDTRSGQDVELAPSGASAGPRMPLRASLWRRITASRALAVGTSFVLLLLAASFLAPVLLPYGPLEQSPQQLLGPSLAHPFGTDELGRDILVRCLVGSRSTLAVAVLAAVSAAAVGTLIGLVAGYAGRWLDSALMRVMDVLLSVPSILIALVIVALLGPSTTNLVLAIAIVEVPTFARLARASALSVREREYVTAARAAGAGHWDIMVRTVLPNILGPQVVQIVVAAASAILVAAALSFLGLGEAPPAPSLGGMLQDSQGFLGQSVWYPLFPGLLIALCVAAFDGIGSGLSRLLSGSSTFVTEGMVQR